MIRGIGAVPRASETACRSPVGRLSPTVQRVYAGALKAMTEADERRATTNDHPEQRAERDGVAAMTTAKRMSQSAAMGVESDANADLRAVTPATPATPAMPATEAAAATRRGKVEVSAHAIGAIAAQATLECYGGAGLAPRRQRLGASERLGPADLARGVEVRFVDDHVVIELWVILEHSLRVVEVAHNIMVIVKYAVEQALELHVVQVNVTVQALRVRD